VDNISEYLGKVIFPRDRLYDNNIPPNGVVAGLAYNQIGGSMIWIESVITGIINTNNNNNMSRYKTTGKLGDVMKESAEISYAYAKTLTHKLFPENKFFMETAVHTHFPEGAIPKDGPSAGCGQSFYFLFSFLFLLLF